MNKARRTLTPYNDKVKQGRFNRNMNIIIVIMLCITIILQVILITNQ